jgi:hypothetical protein
MTEPDDAAAEKRAKELAERDGFAWELSYRPEANKLERFPCAERRQEYLTRARAELLSEQAR